MKQFAEASSDMCVCVYVATAPVSGAACEESLIIEREREKRVALSAQGPSAAATADDDDERGGL